MGIGSSGLTQTSDGSSGRRGHPPNACCHSVAGRPVWVLGLWNISWLSRFREGPMEGLFVCVLVTSGP